MIKYDNYKMLNQDGSFMCFINEKRFKWYLKKNIANKIDDHTIQITFEPEGRGSLERCSPFYLEEIDNRCVVCGTEENLTRHHILPTRYRKNLPQEIKGSNHFDVVLICRDHHDAYEIEAKKLDEELYKKYNIQYNVKTPRIILTIKGLLRNYDLIPFERRQKYIKDFEKFLNKEIHEVDISKEIKKYEIKIEEEFLSLLHKIGDVDDFAIMWRKHFVDITKPKYIKKSWLNDIEKRFYHYNWEDYKND